MTDDFLNYLKHAHTVTPPSPPPPPLSSSIQLHLHQVIRPRWLEAAAPSSTLISSVPGYEKQTAGLAQTSRSPSLKPKRFPKTNKLLPPLSTQGFYETLKLPFFWCWGAPPLPISKYRLKTKSCAAYQWEFLSLAFQRQRKGTILFFRLSTGNFLSLFARAQLELIIVFWHRNTIVPAAKLLLV